MILKKFPISIISPHCIKSELYLAKWKWILRSGPKLKMLVKFHSPNGSFPNPLNWWRIRFGCTTLDQCYWNKENWFANWGLICCWRNTFTTDTLRSCLARPPPPHKKTVLCIQGDSTSYPWITMLRLWPLDHSSSEVWCERERLNITYKLGYWSARTGPSNLSLLSLAGSWALIGRRVGWPRAWSAAVEILLQLILYAREWGAGAGGRSTIHSWFNTFTAEHKPKPECQSQKANNACRKPPVYIDEKIQHILASTMPLIIEFFIKIKSQFGRFWGQTRIIILILP